MEEYKVEIENTRVGCLGSSDAYMVARIAGLGHVPSTDVERLAIAKGLCEQKKNITTEAMRFGDYIEQAIFAYVSSNGKNYESNPMWESKKYSRKNVKAISHPDIVLVDEDTKYIHVYEVKASKYDTQKVRNEYRHQLFWHYQFAKEKAEKLGKEWKYKVYLVHYNTEGVDYANHEFDVDRLTIKEVRFPTPIFDINNGMDIIDEYLENLDSYYSDDEIDANLLPQNVYDKFLAVCDTLETMKRMEMEIDEFKAKIYEFMLEQNIKSIKNEQFTISRVDPSESVTFDGKRFLTDYAKDHPTKAKWIARQYEKRTQRKGYAVIKIKNK